MSGKLLKSFEEIKKYKAEYAICKHIENTTENGRHAYFYFDKDAIYATDYHSVFKINKSPDKELVGIAICGDGKLDYEALSQTVPNAFESKYEKIGTFSRKSIEDRIKQNKALLNLDEYCSMLIVFDEEVSVSPKQMQYYLDNSSDENVNAYKREDNSLLIKSKDIEFISFGTKGDRSYTYDVKTNKLTPYSDYFPTWRFESLINTNNLLFSTDFISEKGYKTSINAYKENKVLVPIFNEVTNSKVEDKTFDIEKRVSEVANGNIDLSKFTCDDELRPAMYNKYYLKGYVAASDTHIIAYVKDQYKKEREGKIYNIADYDVSKGLCLPDFTKLFDEYACGDTIKFDVKRIEESCKLVSMMPKEERMVQISTSLFSVDYLEKVLYFVKFCKKPQFYIAKPGNLYITDEGGIHNLMLMPREVGYGKKGYNAYPYCMWYNSNDSKYYRTGSFDDIYECYIGKRHKLDRDVFDFIVNKIKDNCVDLTDLYVKVNDMVELRKNLLEKNNKFPWEIRREIRMGNDQGTTDLQGIFGTSDMAKNQFKIGDWVKLVDRKKYPLSLNNQTYPHQKTYTKFSVKNEFLIISKDPENDMYQLRGTERLQECGFEANPKPYDEEVYTFVKSDEIKPLPNPPKLTNDQKAEIIRDSRYDLDRQNSDKGDVIKVLEDLVSGKLSFKQFEYDLNNGRIRLEVMDKECNLMKEVRKIWKANNGKLGALETLSQRGRKISLTGEKTLGELDGNEVFYASKTIKEIIDFFARDCKIIISPRRNYFSVWIYHKKTLMASFTNVPFSKNDLSQWSDIVTEKKKYSDKSSEEYFSIRRDFRDLRNKRELLESHDKTIRNDIKNLEKFASGEYDKLLKDPKLSKTATSLLDDLKRKYPELYKRIKNK